MEQRSLTETLSRGCEAISGFTLAAVTPRHVQAGCVLLTHRSILALINI